MVASTNYRNSEGDYHLPDLQVACFKNAEYYSIYDVIKRTNVVIDFWTTKCTRCPAALDKLNNLARLPKYSNAQFISICCDSCDGARNIIEEYDELKWTSINHYSISIEDKELAKLALGFTSVPFYVVLDSLSCIVQRGSQKKINFDNLFLEKETKIMEEKEDDIVKINVKLSMLAKDTLIVSKEVRPDLGNRKLQVFDTVEEKKVDNYETTSTDRVFKLDEDF